MWGLSTRQKTTGALRGFCYGSPADATDEYLRIVDSTDILAAKRFTIAVVVASGSEYLRQPSDQVIERLATINSERGFLGTFGSMDRTHWDWKNCPIAWQGMFQDRGGRRSVAMEAIAT